MKRATGTCVVCTRAFRYFQITKPRTTCSGGCLYRRERQLQRDLRARKRRARSGALNCSH